MWFKNLIIYRFKKAVDLNDLEEKLATNTSRPCKSLEMDTYGWISPTGKLSDLLEHTGLDFTLLCAKKEEKILPASVVRDFVNEKIELIQDEQNRKVTKKEKDEIKDEVLLELTPKAFSKYYLTYGLLMPKQGFLVINASTIKKSEEFTALLRKTLGSLSITPLEVKNDPVSVFTAWLDEKEIPPEDIVLGTECELKSTAEDGAIARCRKQNLQSDEIKAHLEAGKQVIKLGLEWNESLSFVLTEDLDVKKLKFDDALIEEANNDADDALSAFDADFALMSSELEKFLQNLITTFGGEKI